MKHELNLFLQFKSPITELNLSKKCFYLNILILLQKYTVIANGDTAQIKSVNIEKIACALSRLLFQLNPEYASVSEVKNNYE